MSLSYAQGLPQRPAAPMMLFLNVLTLSNHAIGKFEMPVFRRTLRAAALRLTEYHSLLLHDTMWTCLEAGASESMSVSLGDVHYRRLLAGTFSTSQHPDVAVRHAASRADCFRWTSDPYLEAVAAGHRAAHA